MNGPARQDVLQFIESRHGRKLGAHEAADLFAALDLDGAAAQALVADFAKNFAVDLTGYEPAYHHRSAFRAACPSWPVAVPAPFGLRLPLSVSTLTEAAQSGRWPLRYPPLAPVPARDWMNLPLILVALPVLAAGLIWVVRGF